MKPNLSEIYSGFYYALIIIICIYINYFEFSETINTVELLCCEIYSRLINMNSRTESFVIIDCVLR